MIGQNLQVMLADGISNHAMVHLVFEESLFPTEFPPVVFCEAFNLIISGEPVFPTGCPHQTPWHVCLGVDTWLVIWASRLGL